MANQTMYANPAVGKASHNRIPLIMDSIVQIK